MCFKQSKSGKVTACFSKIQTGRGSCSLALWKQQAPRSLAVRIGTKGTTGSSSNRNQDYETFHARVFAAKEAVDMNAKIGRKRRPQAIVIGNDVFEPFSTGKRVQQKAHYRAGLARILFQGAGQDSHPP